MMNLIYIGIGLIVLFLALVNVLLITLIMRIRNKTKLDKTRITMEDKKINIRSDIDETSFGLLDIFIQKQMDDYLVMNPKYLQSDYINSDMQTELNRGICKAVGEYMSPALYDKLELLYNKDSISDIIAKKVYIRTLYYVVDHNKMKK